MKKLRFELRGKNAALVFADADLEAAASGVARSAFTNGGQVCMCTERVYVERPVFEAFVTRVAGHAAALRLGWPAEPGTDMGPMISAPHRDKVLAAYAQGVTFTRESKLVRRATGYERKTLKPRYAASGSRAVRAEFAAAIGDCQRPSDFSDQARFPTT